MAVLFITEYAEIQIGLGGRMGQIPVEPPLAEQTLSVSASSAQSLAFNAATQLVRIRVDSTSAMGITFGTNPTAIIPSGTAGSGGCTAGSTEFRAIPRGQSFKLAAILISA